MGNEHEFNVYRKCVHKISKCRRCHVTPLLNKSGEPVSYYVEHFNRFDKLLSVTLGDKGIVKRPLKKLRKNAVNQSVKSIPNKPEMADAHIELTDSPVSSVQVDPSLQSLHEDSSVMTEPESTEHIKSTLGTQLEQVQAQMKSSFSAPVVRKAARSIEQLVLLIIGLQYDSSLEAMVVRCVSFLSAITESGIVMTLKDALMKYVQEAKFPKIFDGKTVGEAYNAENSVNKPEGMIMDSTVIWETMKQGIFTKHLSYVLGTVFAFSACQIKNVKFNHPVYESVMKHATADEIDGMDLIDHAIKLYNWTSTVGMACLEARSLEPLTINTSTLAKCHEKYYFWHKRFLDFKRSGTSTLEERQLMHVEVECIYKKLEQITKVQKDKFLTLQSSSLCRDVLTLYNDVQDFVRKVDKVKVAKGFHIFGTPKCGKSDICPKIAEQMCLARGVEYRKEDNAQINLLAPYQDELNNSTQIITINETLPIKENLAKSVETAYNTSLALVDPVPFHPNRSNLEDKAKITCTHIGVISTGNTVQPFLNVAKTPGAWERRFTIVEMKVKEKYSDEFGRLVSSKCDGSEDYHWFDVYEIIYVGKERKIAYYTYEGRDSLHLNTEEFFELVRKLCKDHYAEQDVIEQRHSTKANSGCMTCQRLSQWCKCPDKEWHTKSGVTVNLEESSVTSVKTVYACPRGYGVGSWKTPCKFVDNICVNCGTEIPVYGDEGTENKPEMGILPTLASTAGSIMWSTMLPWINPFIKMKWLWSIDNNVMQVFHEELVEELSFIPDTIGCTALSLIPHSWETRADGSRTWLGKRKDSFIRMMAAEKQIFLPLSYLLRRAFCWGLLTFIITMSFCYVLERCGLNPREYEQVVLKSRTYNEWGWKYLYPEYSEYVFQRRDFYADLGIYTENYLDWNDYYINIYFFQKILGMLCIPWYFEYTRFVAVLETRMYEWWLMPLIISCSVTIFLFLYMWYRRWLGFDARYRDLQRRTSTDSNLQHVLYDKARRHCTEYNSLIPTAVGVMGAVVTGLVMWNSIRNSAEFGDIRRDSNTKSWSDWFSFNREVAEPYEQRNSSNEEVANVVSKSLTTIEATLDDKKRTIHGVYLRPGVLLIPRHFFKPDPYKEEVVEYLDLFMVTNGVPHKCRAYTKAMVQIDGKDAFLLKVPKAPKIQRSVDVMLPRKSGTDYIKTRLLFLKDKKLMTECVNAKYVSDVDCAGFSCGRGLEYVSHCSGDGFCGTPVIADRRDGAILGFHIAGRAHGLTSRKGFAQEITYGDYERALAKLANKPFYISTPEMRSLRTTRLGQNLIPCEGPHPKTEMFKDGAMDPYHCIEVLGHDPILTRYRSRVTRGLLSDSITEHCGIPCRWKAPYFKEPWVHHNKALEVMAEGAWDVPPDSLEWAVNDYLGDLLPPLREHMKKHPELCRPLTLDEAINGVSGSLYMGPFKMDTSAGIPTGSKEDSGLFNRIEPYPDGRKRYELTPIALKYYEEMLQMLDNEEALGIWVKTCLKDEVVAEDSEKVRIFYILECLFGLICRQYFLPVAEFISRHPLTSECMVGVNCAGPEWEQLMTYIHELATDGQLSDLDYRKYDLLRAMNMMIASLKVMIRIGEVMEFPESILKRMAGAAEELRSPIINWNGTIIWTYLWCSGNSMTVYGNSIENSLHQRASFHWNGTRKRGDDFYKLGKFRDNEHIATYGDDLLSGCKPEVRDVCDFHAKKEYFDFINMKVTDARKSDNPPATVHHSEVDFLKRKSVYHPELGVRVGALNVDSIWKMGHMSAAVGEPEDLAISSLQSMLTEAFLHGEEFYEDIRSKLQLCAKDHKIWTDVLDRSYSDKVEMWKEKYSS